MLYLLDANVLIDANRDYYPISRVPEFWAWLQHHGTCNFVKIPLEAFEELKIGTDGISAWARDADVAISFLLDEEVDPTQVAMVIDQGYAPDLTDDEVENLGRDPFLAAYALVEPSGRCIVTTERSRPSRQRANRHLPDVCDALGLR